MSAKPRQLSLPNVGTAASTIPMGLRILAIVLRALFIGAFAVVVARVSSPQSENHLRPYTRAPGDLIRLALGFAVYLWIVIHLFMLPKDAEGYRTWVYLGLVVAPLPLKMAAANACGRPRCCTSCSAMASVTRIHIFSPGHDQGLFARRC